jgi:hypothetical protein
VLTKRKASEAEMPEEPASKRQKVDPNLPDNANPESQQVTAMPVINQPQKQDAKSPAAVPAAQQQ